MLTRRAAMNVSRKLRRTSRASGRVLEGSMGSSLDSAMTASDTALLDRTELHGLAERGQRVPRGHELVRHEAGEAGVGNRLSDGAVVQLLRVIQLMATRYAAGVEVPDMLGVLA